MTAEFTTVLSASELPVGAMRAVTIGARELVLCHTKDGLFAVDNICTHAYARLCEGRLRGTRLICPLHGASFDARDGRVLGPPATLPLEAFTVRITDGMIEVATPAAAPV
jgi:nitrite reductase/ring-hydroxylating ferredoxin subunit